MIFKTFLLERRWIILTFSLGVVTLATSAYIMFREIYRPKSPSDILSRYGHLFQSEDDIVELNKIIQSRRLKPVKKSKTGFEDSCTLTCPKNDAVQVDTMSDIFERNSTEPSRLYSVEKLGDINTNHSKDTEIHDKSKTAALRDQSQRTLLFHGCCISYEKWVPHEKLVAVKSQKQVRVVQFKKMKQFFLTDECKQDTSCDRGCNCMQQTVMTTALVVDLHSSTRDLEDNYKDPSARIVLVEYPGWCKCLNINT